MPELNERVATLEANVMDLHEDMRTMSADLKETNKKLDELLELKNKGMGAFWLISILMGAAFSAIITFISGWIK